MKKKPDLKIDPLHLDNTYDSNSDKSNTTSIFLHDSDVETVQILTSHMPHNYTVSVLSEHCFGPQIVFSTDHN